MVVGIRIEGGGDHFIYQVRFCGFDVGVDAEDCNGLELINNRFDRVKSPVKAREVSGLVAKDNVDNSVPSERANGLRMTLIASFVKFYIKNLKDN